MVLLFSYVVMHSKIALFQEEREMCLRKCTVRPQDTSEQSLVAMLEERLNEAESSIQDYRDENTVLKCELRDLQACTVQFTLMLKYPDFSLSLLSPLQYLFFSQVHIQKHRITCKGES